MVPSPFKTTRSAVYERPKAVQTVSEGERASDGTVSINLSKYYYRRSTDKGTRIVPLEQQFRSIYDEVLSHGGIGRFVTDHLYGREPVKTVYFLHPAFDKAGPEPPELDNVVMRTVSAFDRDLDIVFSGNFEFNDKIRIWEFMVTGVMTAGHTGKYIGETELKCSVYLTLKDGSDVYYDTDGREIRNRKTADHSKNIINPGTVSLIKEKYPVLNPRETRTVLNDWLDFLDMRESSAGCRAEEGFRIRRPVFIQSCFSDLAGLKGKNILVSDGTTGWTDEIIPGMPQCILVKIEHVISKALSKPEMRRYTDKFNAATKGIVRIMDPAEDGSFREPEEREKDKNYSSPGERISEAVMCSSFTEEETFPIEEEYREEIRRIDGLFEEKAAELKAQEISRYEKSDEFIRLLEETVSEGADEIAAEAETIRKGKAEELYLGLMESGPAGSVPGWDEIYNSVDSGECAAEAAVRYREKKAGKLLRKKEGELNSSIKSSLKGEFRLMRDAAKEKRDAALGELSLKLSKNVLTVYFRIIPGEEESVVQGVRSREEYFSGRREFVIAEDDAAERSSIERQRQAVRSLLNGTMTNPYLISFLFSPEIAPLYREVPAGHLFGTHFNPLQLKAINGAVSSNGIYLIQGPPGTGKTQVIAEITAQEVIRGRKVLIASQGNKAVDNAFDRLRPYSFIRPIRIMAEKKESRYELKEIVSTFYEGIRSGIDLRAEFIGNPGEVSGALEKIAGIREYYREKYTSSRSGADSIIRKLRSVSREFNERLDKLNCDNAQLESNRKRYYAACDMLSRLDDFEQEDYRDYVLEIRSLFSFVQTSGDKDRVLFGRDGICSSLIRMSEDTLSETEEFYGACYDEGNLPGDIFSVLYSGGKPRSLRNVRLQLETIRDILRSVSEADRDEYEKSSRLDPADAENVIKLYQSRISSLEEQQPFIEFSAAEKEIRGMISGLFSALRITDRYETVEDAMKIVNRTEAVLGSLSGNLSGAEEECREISGYLSEKNTPGIDSEILIDEFSGYVNVVGMTCTVKENVAGVKKDEGPQIDLRRMGIDTVIIDEVSKVPFPELIRPMSFGKKIILVGDHKQLPPVYNERNEDNDLRELNRKYAGMYSEPLFQKMFEAAGSHSKTMLRTQYRMTSEIMGVINRFYGGALEMPEGVPEKEHRISAAGKTRPLIVPEHSVLFIDCRGRERMESGSTSFSNESEAETVFRMVRILDACCKYDSDGNPLEDPDRRMSMGVITPYSDQMKLIKKKLRMDAGAETDLKAFRNDGEERFMVKAVDDFQGDERDIIILSLVRTSASRFISDFRRINVAMSRARRLLIIVGNAGILEKTPVEIDGKQEYVYKDIISDLRLRGCFADSSEVVL